MKRKKNILETISPCGYQWKIGRIVQGNRHNSQFKKSWADLVCRMSNTVSNMLNDLQLKIRKKGVDKMITEARTSGKKPHQAI